METVMISTKMTYPFEQNVWYTQMSLQSIDDLNLLTVGNEKGEIHGFQIDHTSPSKNGTSIFTAKIEDKVLIRKVWVSSTGDMLFAISDNSKLWFQPLEAGTLNNVNKKSTKH